MYDIAGPVVIMGWYGRGWWWQDLSAHHRHQCTNKHATTITHDGHTAPFAWGNAMTWEEAHQNKVSALFWPGWEGYIKIAKITRNEFLFQAFDGNGAICDWQQDYRDFSHREEWMEWVKN